MKSDKKIVMCDTMIWYDVYDAKEKLEKDKFKYYGSGINIGDFLSSDKMELSVNEKIKLKNAIKTMHKEAEDVICVDPMTAAASNLLGVEIDDKEHRQYQNAYNILVDYAYGRTRGIYGPGRESLIAQKSAFQKATLDIKRTNYNLSQKT